MTRPRGDVKSRLMETPQNRVIGTVPAGAVRRLGPVWHPRCSNVSFFLFT